MPAWFFGSLLLAIAYGLVVEFYRQTWLSMPVWEVPPSFVPRTRISVVIPARNEEQTIGACLESLKSQNYPGELFEVIVIDDHSEDRTPEVVRSFSGLRLSLVHLADDLSASRGFVAYKKSALSLGIRQACGEFILTTDADCILPSGWLLQMASCYELRGWQCISGPVLMHREKNLLERFQSLDFLGMMVLTGAGIQRRFTHLANGAAFAFSKSAYEAVGGYSGTMQLASGDDLLLMHKMMAHYPGSVGFLKTPYGVKTPAQESWKGFFQQRLRWGTKSGGYSDWRITAVLALVFFYCWSILLNFLLLPWTFGQGALLLGLQLGVKAWTDYRMLQAATTFFERKDLLQVFWPAQVLHILYIGGVGLASNLLKTYTWKGRRVK